MVNIMLCSDNTDFADDLQNQISRFVTKASFSAELPDIIIIDDNLSAYAQQREKHSSVPIIFMAGKNSINQDNLNIAIRKPFSLIKLLDIIKAANNKLDNSTDGYLIFNGYELHPNKREILDLESNETTKLTEKEVDIIKYLYKAYPEYVSKTDLQTNVWKYNGDVATHTIETHIYRLRQKAEKNSSRRLILTENGGYKLNAD